MSRLIEVVSKWLLPFGIYSFFYRVEKKVRSLMSDKKVHIVLKENSDLMNIHKGGRCFILGSGKSIARQDLSFLKNEISFSLNLFYLHDDYDLFKPRYHVFSGMANHPDVSLEKGLEIYREIEKKIRSEILFLNYKDLPFVTKNNLFNNNVVRYVQYTKPIETIHKYGINMDYPIYKVYNVAMVAMQIAFYMGFKEIYLLGLDHDWVIRKAQNNYNEHFYNPLKSIVDRGEPLGWKVEDLESQFWLSMVLWRQYKELKKYADQKEVKIFNATEGGILDIFSRVKYESIFNVNQCQNIK